MSNVTCVSFLLTTGYIVDTSGYLVVMSGYITAIIGYFWLLLVTSHYIWFLLLVTTNYYHFIINASQLPKLISL